MPDAGQIEKRQKVLADFGEFALRSDDLDAVLTEACRLVADALGTGRAKVLEIVDEGRTLFVRAGVGWDQGVVGRVRLSMSEPSSETYSIEAGEPVITNDLASEDRFDFPAFMKEAGVKALANVPIFLPGGRPFGLLQVDAPEPRAFGDEDTQFLRTYATILGPVIDRLLKVQALGATEERFRTIVEAARDYAIFLTDPEDRITDWLPGAEAVFGWTAEEAIGHPAEILFTPEDREAGEPETEVKGARENGSAPDVRWHLRKDGSRVFIEGSVIALRDKAGGLRGFQKIGQDVTKRRLAEEALRESEERQRFLLALGDAMRAETSASVKVQVAARHLGERLNASRVLWGEYDWQTGLAHVFDGWFADGSQPFPTVMQLEDYDGEVLDKLRAGQTVRVDNVSLHVEEPAYAAIADLGVQALLSVPLIVDGRLAVNVSIHQHEPRHWTDNEVALVQDVAERLWAEVVRARAEAALGASEEKYRTLFDAIDEGLAIVEMIYDDRGDITDMIFRQVNAAYERQGGIHNVIGRSVLEMLPGVEEVWLDRYGKVARTGQPLRVEDYQQDVGRWFDVYFSRVDEAGRFVAIVFNDITERKRAEAELRASEERQAFLLKLSDVLQRLTAPNDIKTAAMHMLGTHLGVSRAQYHEVDSTGEYYSADGIGYAEGLPLLDLKYRIGQFGSFVAADFEAGRPFRSDDLLTDSRPTAEEREAYGFYGIRAGAGIPLLRGGKLVAVLAVHDMRPHPWTDLEMELIRETAERVWVAVEKVRTEIAVRESEERQAFLLMLSDRLRTEADPRSIAVTALGLLADHMRLDRAYMAEVDKSRDLAEIGPEYRRPDLAPVEGVLALSHFPEAFARVEAATLALANTESDQTLSDLDRQGFAALRMGALIVASARKGTRNPVWALLVATEKPRHWTAAEVALVEEVAERIWAATEHARADVALSESEARLQSALSINTVGVMFWSEGFELTQVNDAFLAMTGFSRAEAHGRTWQELTPEEFHLESWRAVEQVTTLGEATPYEKQYFRKDGSRWWGLFAPRKIDGEVVEFVLDVTARKEAEAALRESEERFRQFADASTDVLWIRNAQTMTMEYLNPVFERVYGRPQEELLAEGPGEWEKLIHPDDRASVLSALERVRTGEQVTHEFRLLHPDGQVRWIEDTDFPLFDPQGQVQRIGGFAKDVTEKKEAADRMKVLVAELQHRTRNLIAVVRSIAQQTMAQTGPTEAFRDEFNHRLEALARVQGLLSRAEEEPVTIESLIRMELDALGALNGVGERISLSGPSVRLRNSLVQTLALGLHELATNARKHGALSRDDGRLSVTWQVTEADGEGRRLALKWSEARAEEGIDTTPERRGYGRELIEQALPYALGAQTSYEITPQGVRCTIDLPLDKKQRRRRPR